MKKSHTKAIVALLLASVIWGGTPPIMKLTLLSVPIFSLAFIRFGAASALLLPFVLHKLHVAKKDVLPILLCGLFGITYNIAFFFWGLTKTTALNAGIITATVPIFTLFFAEVLLKEKVTSKLILGSLLGLLGIVVIISKDVLQAGISFSPLGDILLLLSTISFVLYEILSKKVSKTYSPLIVTFYMFFVGGLSFLPAALYEFYINPNWMVHLPLGAVIGILYGVFGASFMAYALWNWGLSQLDAARVGFFFYLDPIVSTILAVVLLSETITPPFLLGSFFILAGLLLAEGHLPYRHIRQELNI